MQGAARGGEEFFSEKGVLAAVFSALGRCFGDLGAAGARRGLDVWAFFCYLCSENLLDYGAVEHI